MQHYIHSIKIESSPSHSIMKKLWLREVKWLVQEHRASDWRAEVSEELFDKIYGNIMELSYNVLDFIPPTFTSLMCISMVPCANYLEE